ncbi:MAG: response regulator [Negativicutes bacterium]|nr:response regulator [Negativicutes bacterium]
MARILVVDDSLMIRKTLRIVFERAGHVVVAESANGEQAIAHYTQFHPDLVTLDITMPGLNGIETLKRILASDPNANVVMVSALGQKHMVFDALQAGAKNYMLKPLNEEKLLAVVSLVLENRQDSAAPTAVAQ